MRIIYIGTVIFSETMLRKLVELKANVVGVLTRQESKVNSDFKDLSVVCKEKSIDSKYFENINDSENVDWIHSKTPDIIFCFGLSQIIRREILSIPQLGVVGYHPTLLPQNRGRYPLIWAIALGLKKTGSSYFFMDEGADTGDILSQAEIEIKHGMSSQDLYEEVTSASLIQVEKFLPELQRGSYVRHKQDHSEANSWRKRGKKDGEVDFRMNNDTVHRLVLALSKPYVGAHLVYKGADVKVWKTNVREESNTNYESGKTLKSDESSIIVKCGNGSIELIEHEFTVLPEVGEYL
jgi:methionyl-tRNA formyltransferase